MAQPFQSLDPGSASRAIADQDAVESVVLDVISAGVSESADPVVVIIQASP